MKKKIAIIGAGIAGLTLANFIKKNSDLITRWTGTWGDLSTQSFYPPHHLTTGEGGAINIMKPILKK